MQTISFIFRYLNNPDLQNICPLPKPLVISVRQDLKEDWVHPRNYASSQKSEHNKIGQQIRIKASDYQITYVDPRNSSGSKKSWHPKYMNMIKFVNCTNAMFCCLLSSQKYDCHRKTLPVGQCSQLCTYF